MLHPIINVRNIIREIDDRPRTDTFDAWNYLKYHGFKRLNLTEADKQELRNYGNEIAE